MMSLSPRVVAGIGAASCAAVAAGGVPMVEAVWVPLEIDLVECPELTDYASADLYLAFDVDPGDTVAVTSDDETGIAISGGEFYQDETGANGPRPEGWYEVFPCARWDSYLTIGGTTPFFSPTYPMMDLDDWGPRIVAEWLPNPGDPIEVEMDPEKFGDMRHYVRIARLTGTPGTTSIDGVIEVVFFPYPASPMTPEQATVNVETCVECFDTNSADLDGNGVIGQGDLAALLAAWGPCVGGCPADLDDDGVVGSLDLAAVLAVWGT